MILADHDDYNNACYWDVWYDRGAVVANLGRSRQAIECFDKAIRLNPDDADAWYNKGGLPILVKKQ